MGSLQRRRGSILRVHTVRTVEDHRGNAIVTPDGPAIEVRAAIIPDRSARAEVPGQMHIDVVKAITEADLSDVNLWSRVELDGRVWDVVAPPERHVGRRATRHWCLTLRARVDGDTHIPGGSGG